MNLFIFDLDGVIYIGNTLLPGVRHTLDALEKRRERICFLSNNSTLSRKGHRKKLAGLGLRIAEEQLFPSSYICALYLKNSRNITPAEKVMIIGEKGLYQELKGAHVSITRDLGKVRYVVVGMDRKLTYRKLSRAHRALLKGAEFIATNADSTYPLEETTVPAAGAIVGALEVCTQKIPLILGKPETFGLKILLQKTGFAPSQVVLVGDRLETDIALGNTMGIKTVLVLSGISSRQEMEKAPFHMQPSYVISSLPELLSLEFT